MESIDGKFNYQKSPFSSVDYMKGKSFKKFWAASIGPKYR
jgi:hypothetical protein